MDSYLAGFASGALLTAILGWYYMDRRLKLVGAFLASVLHEINTPITAINMTVLNFINGVFGSLAEEHTRWMEMLRTQTSRLGGMSGELRDIVHFELKKDLILRAEETSLEEAVALVMESVSKGIPAAELKLTLEIPEDFPLLMADPDRLPRTIQSLLFHARKFRTSGPIAMKAKVAGERALLCVEYSGPKILPYEVEKTMDLYYPAYRRRDQLLCAVGLGLGALRALTRLQGGELEYEVDSEGGTKMTLHFPLAKRKVAEGG